ncbi:hypothetical protein HanHA300_Chr15g0564421 [Helianthus annuus]|nr:hypothetical protein HanHA300_Chr15g0564421 [Helianthus annuus]KAJ0473031.1 hypothetical protein HanHA89_Chr15g0613711 [Helianthus annuus]KAJ0648633.1 hypothetical protein HanLR1_Chr15g0575081 [Helianthus annuus]
MSCSDYYTMCQNIESLKEDRTPIDSQQHVSKENEDDFLSKFVKICYLHVK